MSGLISPIKSHMLTEHIKEKHHLSYLQSVLKIDIALD